MQDHIHGHLASRNFAPHAANPRAIAFTVLAASLSQLGRMDEAKAVLDQLYERQPNFKISTMPEVLALATGPKFPDALRKAGVPE